jgi:hypothetical protein
LTLSKLRQTPEKRKHELGHVSRVDLQKRGGVRSVTDRLQGREEGLLHHVKQLPLKKAI